MKTLYLLTLVFLIFYGCGDKCDDAAIDYGTVDIYTVTRKMFELYKDKSLMVLKNENGDQLNLSIQFSPDIYTDTLSKTLEKNRVCTSETLHFNIINIVFEQSDTNYLTFTAQPNYSFNYSSKNIKKERDHIDCGWFKDKNSQKGVPYSLNTYIVNPKSLPHKTVNIHGKDVEVIDAAEISPEQVFIHEDKGIVAMKVPNHGTGYWVVDKVE